MSVCVCSAPYLLLKALLFLAAVLPSSADCPKPCVCYVPTEVHCTFKYLSAVPDHIQPAVERINLGYNSITVLREHDLSGFENLELLMLHSNTIHSVEDRAFQDLKSLQVLKMSYNKIKEIKKETFKGLESLQRLQIDHNHIEFINPEAFYGLNNLQLVHLEGNYLQQLHPDTFITLRHSQVFKVSSVRSIHLSDNLLTTLPADIFSGCSQLENLFLHGNRWTCDCRMTWFSAWVQRNTGVLKCKRDRRYPRGQLCPVCENPAPYHNRGLSLLHSDAFTCTKPLIQPHLKQRNITLDEGNFTPLSSKDFTAPLGSIQMNLTDQFHKDASLSCIVQRPTDFQNLTQTVEQEEGNNVTVLTTGITTYLVCNINYEHIQQLWQILAAYSDSPMRLERGVMLARSPEMVYRYSQIKTMEGEEGIYTQTEADIKASPAWLMQGEVSFQLDRTTTTFSTLHIKYQSVVSLRVENAASRRDRYSWTMIKKDNHTKTEHTVLTGGVAQLQCQVQGEPQPLLEWILPDGSKVRAPFSSDDRRIVITAEGKLTLRGADASDTGLYWCIATNYLDADVLVFRVTVLSPDVEEAEVNGVHLTKPLGENMVLDCSPSGTPDTLVTWILPDHSILDKSQGNRKVYGNGTLLILGLTERDRGFYRCLVSNHLGVDLLVSQVTVIGERPEAAVNIEGSGMVVDVKMDSSLSENIVNFSEIPSSSPVDRTSQESRTITSDRPYPRHRSRGRGTLGQRRRGSMHNRRIWSSRVFEKTSRKVDPQKFAEYMKKAQDGSRTTTDIKYEESQSGDNEIGSGESHDEENLIINLTTGNPRKISSYNRQTETITSTQGDKGHIIVTTELHPILGMENTNTPTTESYMQSDATPVKSLFTHVPSFVETAEFHALEKTSMPPSDTHPVTVQLTVRDESQETQLQFSGEPSDEPETSTGEAFLFTTDPNVTPMRDGPGPVELFIHTDPESQTTFTAVTTTERQQDDITFHTTQTIKSPRLPAGSTIISRQQIHIISRKRGKGRGGWGNFKSHKRIIKPNKITDIQSFINRFKQPMVKMEGNASVPYRIELTTDCDGDSKKTATTDLQVVTPSSLSLHKTDRPDSTKNTAASTTTYDITSKGLFGNTESKFEVSTEYITSADALEFNPTIDPILTTNEGLSASTTTTTTSSKVIRGRIPWNRLFGGKNREQILSRLKKPFISRPTVTTTATITTTPPAMPTTTSVQHITTTSSIDYSRPSTTADTPTELQTLPSPPTVKPPSVKNPDQAVYSGSGGQPDNSLIIRPTPVGKRGWDGQRRRPFRGRGRGSGWARGSKTFVKPRATTTATTTTVVTSMKTTMEATKQLEETDSLYRNTEVVSIDQTTTKEETDLFEEFDWTSGSSSTYTTTINTPLITSTTFNPTTKLMPTTTKRPYTTSQTHITHSNIRPPTQRNNADTTHRPPPRRVKPAVQSRFTTITTASSLPEPETQTPSRHTQSKESSLDDDYGESSSADFEFTTLGPSVQHITTTSSFDYSRSSTTADTPTELQTLPSPPTVKPPSVKNPDQAVYSGSGGQPDNSLIIRQTPVGTRGWDGQRRRPFRGRGRGSGRGWARGSKTFVKPRAYTTTVVTSMKTSGSSPTYTTTITTPLITSTTFNPTTKLMPTTTKRPYTTSQTHITHSNIRPPTQRNNADTTHGPPPRRVKPTVHSSRAKDIAGKDLTFDTMTILTAEKGYTTRSPATHNEDIYDTVSTIYNPVTSYEAPIANTADFESSKKVMTSKPKILGGIAASFTVLSNSDAFLPCEAVGNPQPVITWKRFSSNTGSTIAIKGKMGKFEVLRNGTLSIQNANIKDQGQYHCLAENDHGSDKLLVTLSVVAYPSRILEQKIREIKVHAGNTVEMKCKAEGRPVPMISWILANRTQVRGQNTEKGRVSVSTEGTLVIDDVSVYDRGHYKCIASNPAGVDTATVRLQVVAAPPGIIEEKRQQQKVSLSHNLWLPCTGYGTPQPTIHWVLQDGSVARSHKPVTDMRMSVYENGTLHIKDVTQADSGKYECIATSSTGSERRVVTLAIEAQESEPLIVHTSQHMTELSFGDQLRLNCSATGDPKPRIIWRLPSKAVVDHWHRMGSRIQVLDNGTLIVDTVSDKDAGDYLCVARSRIGDDLQLMKVHVSMKPAKIEPKVYSKKQVAYGNDLKVDCKASGAPKPEISWGLPDGTVVNKALQSDASSGGGRARRYTLFDNGTLFLNQVGISEEGDYTCYAENQVGKDEMHVHITVVTAAPRIRPHSRSYARVKPGGNIRFDCEALGEPKPKILWMLPNNDVIAASSERYLMHVNGSLDIRDVKLNDAGEYVCVARNPGGENRKVYKLDIDGNPPVINGFRQNRTVIKDVATKYSRKLIDCKAEGNPTPTITWLMPDNIFLTAPYFGSRINVHHNGTLEIRNVRPTDTAEFICMARNDGGEAVMVVQLEVTNMLKRPIFKNPFNERIVSRIGKTIVLNCSADGHPAPEVTWTLPNGTRFSGGPKLISRHHFSSDGTLIIYSPNKEDAGKYRCGAKNFVGYIEKLIILDVGEKPYILTRPKGIIRGMSGESLYLHCLSDGSPRPRIYWTLPGGHTLTRPQVLGRYQFLENGTLVVRDTTLHDRGNYICRARNSAGEAVLTVPVITVAYLPRITTAPPPTVRAIAGTPIQLNCAASGIPKPEVTWELPDHSVLSAAEQGRPMGSELLHPQGTLIIQRPTPLDSGKYKCLAKNHLGIDSKVTYVIVL